jgi:hypothetical protein
LWNVAPIKKIRLLFYVIFTCPLPRAPPPPLLQLIKTMHSLII